MPTWFGVLMMVMGLSVILFRKQQGRDIMRGRMYRVGYPVPERNMRLGLVVLGCMGFLIGLAVLLFNMLG
ncbi:MAG: hypothetical protein WBF66_03790 [Dehalococcoidia bacterium]